MTDDLREAIHSGNRLVLAFIYAMAATTVKPQHRPVRTRKRTVGTVKSRRKRSA